MIEGPTYNSLMTLNEKTLWEIMVVCHKLPYQIWWICYMVQFFLPQILSFLPDNDVVIGQVIYQIVAKQVLFQTE